jgi:hypothetical protein
MVRCEYRMPHEGESRMLETAVTGRFVSTAPSTGRFRDCSWRSMNAGFRRAGDVNPLMLRLRVHQGLVADWSSVAHQTVGLKISQPGMNRANERSS